VSKEIDKPFGFIIRDCREAGIPFPKNLATQFERVANKLNETWGRMPTADYLQDLIFPARPGRRGFPPEVAEEILALKNLHEERYARLLETVWDPYDQMYKDKARTDETKKKKLEAKREESKPKGPSIYSTRASAPASAAVRRSSAVSQLLPQVVREQLAQIRASKTVAGPAARVPVPAAETDEILLDAERLLDEEHINSGTSLLELLTTMHPNYSPYTYLRLMEIYYSLKRREDYDWVCQRMCEQYSCEKVEWAATSEAFIKNLDLAAQMFLLA
jgi:hypothetical protein